MNRKNILLVPLMAMFVGCGQSGDLYLPDVLKAEQLEQQAQRETEASRAAQLKAQAATYRQRHQQEQSLRAELAQQEASEKSLRAEGKVEQADKLLKEVNRLRYRLGQLTLEQHRSN